MSFWTTLPTDWLEMLAQAELYYDKTWVDLAEALGIPNVVKQLALHQSGMRVVKYATRCKVLKMHGPMVETIRSPRFWAWID